MLASSRGCPGLLTTLQRSTARLRLGVSDLHNGATAAGVVHFETTLEQAQEAVQKWHGQKWLAPRRLLSEGGLELRSALLPFWLFATTVQVSYSARLGLAVQDAPPGVLRWQEVEEKASSLQDYPWSLPHMQVYASYKYRRDLAEAVKSADAYDRAREVSDDENAYQEVLAGKHSSDSVPLDPPTMRQAIAWELALRSIRQQEADKARMELRLKWKPREIRDLKVQAKPLARHAHLVFLPAHTVSYQYGQGFTAAGERRPYTFQAVVSGTDLDNVAGERHIDPLKAQLAAAGALATGGLAITALSLPFVGLGAPRLIGGAETAFWLFLACSAAGVGARMWPQLLREQSETQRIKEEDQEAAQFWARGLGPTDLGDELAQELRDNAEWRRWEQADKWRWREGERGAWAERLWRGQHERRIARARFISGQTRQRLRDEAEAAQEAARARRWGQSSQYQHFSPGQRNAAGGRRDYKGYYQLLGLDGPSASLSTGDIAKAFRQAALRSHPDRIEAGTEAARDQAAERFQKLSRAYEVLRDPDQRRKYDSGQQPTI
ncbi:hypothetical protein WJX84_008119 [Apatococcus fuscideae]|uniref:J domain-containing protein n=1 Tax=Apatococcus fuscideae TaxID=2026836 RepID=A0AAW1TKW7_9CHLO